MRESLFAVETIRRMRGGSQSWLLKCSDDEYYVAKFQNNPQGVRILANELLGGLLARLLGLPAPEVAVITIDKTLIRRTDDMVIQLSRGRTPCKSGLCVGSRYPRNQGCLVRTPVATVFDLLPQKLFSNVDNIEDFLGMLVFDCWTGNADSRQVVFVCDEHNTSSWPHYSYHAMMIDEGFCFNACKWNFPNDPKRGLYGRTFVYEKVSGLDVFEKWLYRLECGIDRKIIERAAQEIPLEWNDGAAGSLELLINKLDERRFQVRNLLLSTRNAVPRSFPAWHCGQVTPKSYPSTIFPQILPPGTRVNDKGSAATPLD